MRRIILLLVLVSVTISVANSQSKEVLFVGNSYTNVNNLPQITYNVALSAGDTLIYDAHTPGGQTFAAHVGNTTAQAKIASRNWDYVILQGQSQEPSLTNGYVNANVLPFAEALCDTIRANDSCTQPMFYMTWGRKNGDASNCAPAPWVCTYEGMDSALNYRYRQMGDLNDAYVSPVGAVWHYIRDNYPSIELYSADESHPSQAGSYAAACCFYSMIFEKDPTAITFDYTLSAADAANIRNAAKVVAFDSLSKWNVGAFDPVADFSYNQSYIYNDVHFTNLSTKADTFLWIFGDGADTSSLHASHNFGPTIFPQAVRLIAGKCGVYDTVDKMVILLTSGIDETQYSNVNIVPNPTSNSIQINGVDELNLVKVAIYDFNGQILKEINNNFSRPINVTDLPSGSYFIILTNEKGEKLSKQFQKE